MQKLNKKGIRYLLMPFGWAIITLVAFLLAAGQMDNFRVWLAFGINIFGAFVVALLLWRFAPEVANQRASAGEGTKTWDKVILISYFLLTLIITPIIAGIDVGRFKWSQLGTNYEIGGIALYVTFYLLFYWAMLTNEHFEGTSRIQTDREHKVIMHGPYRFVRHPGYSAMVLHAFAFPFIIGSLFSLIPGVVTIILIFVRTFLEDQMLLTELEGYSEYTKKTKYRLLPRIW